MQQILIVLSTWMHALATVLFVGHFILLALIYLPVLAKSENYIIASEISKQSRLWIYTSLVVFSITGIYLTFIDPNYLGLANFGNVWGVAMLVKHILIVAMIGIGFWYNAILRVGPLMRSNNSAEQAFKAFQKYVYLMAVTGVLVFLLTALAQVE